MNVSNAILTIEIDEKTGLYSVYDKKSEKQRVLNASFSIGDYRVEEAKEIRVTGSGKTDKHGKYQEAVITCLMEDSSVMSLSLVLYEKSSAVITKLSLKNNSGHKLQLKSMRHLKVKGNKNSYLSVGRDALKNHRMLSGEAGFAYAHLFDNVTGWTLNDMTIVSMEDGKCDAVLLGNLTMREFQTGVITCETGITEGFTAELNMFDATGKRVDEGSEFVSDLGYLALSGDDPYEIQRQYAVDMASFMDVRLNNYNDFISVCLWYVFAFSLGDRSANTSKGGMDEALAMIKSGITKYAPPMIRLVPDEYVNPNEQLWWDEEHWRRYVHLTEPYETLKKWVDALHSIGAEGGLYMQPTFRSDDYCKEFPGHMLFNDEKNQADYTDPDFDRHMRGVYKTIKEAGIISMFYDYSMLVRGDIRLDDNLLLRAGGFEDPYATSVSAYRRMFEIAKEVCGEKFLITENTWNYSGQELGIGVIDAQRSKMDNVGMNREVVKSGIRQWYRNKMTKLIDPDVKNFTVGNRDIRRKEISLMGLLFGKTMLGSSIIRYDEESIKDIGRILPMPLDYVTAVPLDLFLSPDDGNASVFDYAIDNDNHIVALLNEEMKQEKKSLSLSSPRAFGGLSLDKECSYDIWDFWNECYIGRLKGSETLTQILRSGECRVFAVRKTQNKPFVLSTDRHILQGQIETETVKAYKNRIQLKIKTVAKEKMHVVLALPSPKTQLLEYISLNDDVIVNVTKDAFDPLIHIELESPENETAEIIVITKKQKTEKAALSGSVSGLSAEINGFTGEVKLSWEKKAALRYRVYKNRELLGVVSGDTFTDTSAEENSVIEYSIAAENTNHRVGRMKTLKVKTKDFIPILKYGLGGTQELFGSEGYILFNANGDGKDISKLPQYVKALTVKDRRDYVFKTNKVDRRFVINPETKEPVMGMLHNDKKLELTIAFDDKKVHKITLYCIDCNRSGRTMKLEVRNGKNKVTVPEKTIPEYGEGVHASFKGCGVLNVVLYNGAVNACVTAIYFD